MERLTEKTNTGALVCATGVTLGEVLRRLAAYEDTDLEPEKVGHLKIISEDAFGDKPEFTEHLRELLRAERDGRLVVLPCKVGDTVYHVAPLLKTVEPWKTIALEMAYSAHPFEGNRAMPIKFLSEIITEGKELFLTREKAEAALAERKEATP